MIQFATLCRSCTRNFGNGRCEAFPSGDGIPADIVTFGGDHRSPVKGDRGITYRKRDGSEAQRLHDAWIKSNRVDV